MRSALVISVSRGGSMCGRLQKLLQMIVLFNLRLANRKFITSILNSQLKEVRASFHWFRAKPMCFLSNMVGA